MDDHAHVSHSQTKHDGAKYQYFRAIAANEYKILQKFRIRVWPYIKRAAAAGSDLCPRQEGLQTVARKTASSPSNRRWAEAADVSPPSV
jgi:hypothetical protein